MTVIDTIITCARFMWHVLSWVVSSTWYCSEIVHAFYVEQPSSVQIALFIGFVLIAWLLVVFGTGFYNKFMAVPENEIWINTVRIALFAWNAGEGFGTCVIFTGEGFMEVFKGIFVLLKGLGKFVVGFLGFIIIGFAWPFLAFIVFFYALCAIIYGISWACRDTDRIFMTLEPSHTIAFRRAAGLSVPEQAPRSANHEQAPRSASHEQAPRSASHEQAPRSASHEQAPQAARSTMPEQAPPRRAGPTRYDGPVRNRPTYSRYSPALDPEFEPLRPSSAHRYFDERD
jgi:hypothetical protein